MRNNYLPVSGGFREIINEERRRKRGGNIHYLDEKGNVISVSGRIMNIIEIKNQGEYLLLDSQQKVRLDTIINLYGRSGPSSESLNRISNCMEA